MHIEILARVYKFYVALNMCGMYSLFYTLTARNYNNSGIERLAACIKYSYRIYSETFKIARILFKFIYIEI